MARNDSLRRNKREVLPDNPHSVEEHLDLCVKPEQLNLLSRSRCSKPTSVRLQLTEEFSTTSKFQRTALYTNDIVSEKPRASSRSRKV